MYAPDRPRIARSIADLLEGVTERVALVAADGKSGNHLERVSVGGEHFVVKHQSIDADWLMRVTGDEVFWPFSLLRAGVYDRVPASIDHAIVAMALDGEGRDARLAILLRDVGEALVPEGDDVVTVGQHAGFLAHMAALHASFWGWRDTIGLQPMRARLLSFTPSVIAPELARADPPVPVRVADQGWRALPTVAPRLDALVRPLHDDPGPLVEALASTPSCLVHGDWKMGNLGTHDDGRTILLDWAYPGEAPPIWDLVWYLALNRARLPETKEASVERYRAALEAAGIDTAPWWDRQLGLCFLAIMVLFAWEKAVGDAEELAWWEERALDGSRWLP